mgnify:CR=1 FL=1
MNCHVFMTMQEHDVSQCYHNHVSCWKHSISIVCSGLLFALVVSQQWTSFLLSILYLCHSNIFTMRCSPSGLVELRFVYTSPRRSITIAIMSAFERKEEEKSESIGFVSYLIFVSLMYCRTRLFTTSRDAIKRRHTRETLEEPWT